MRSRLAASYGSGSSFRVRLPYGQVAGAEAVAEARPTAAARSYLDEALGWHETSLGETLIPAPAQSPATGVARGTVLIVDDNSDLRLMLARLLSPYYSVQTAGDGQQALELVRQQAPDLVLADVMMPRFDGLGLLRALREDRRQHRCP